MDNFFPCFYLATMLLLKDLTNYSEYIEPQNRALNWSNWQRTVNQAIISIVVYPAMSLESDPWQRHTTPPIFFFRLIQQKGAQMSMSILPSATNQSLYCTCVWGGGWYNTARGLISREITVYPRHFKKYYHFVAYSKKVTGRQFSQNCLSEKVPGFKKKKKYSQHCFSC